ncbi:MAG: HAD family hydrolase [Candidatus Sulfotelmatobacter sp.]
MSNQLRCIVFDMDDTLYLERDYVRSGFLHVGALVEKKFGVSGFYDEAWELFLEGERGDIFDRALKRISLPAPDLVIRELVDAYRNHAPAISLADDAVQCLDGVRPKYDLALITDGSAVSQENKARALQLDRWIDLKIFTGRWGTNFYKPHPRAFLAVQEQTGASPNECIYVADNPNKDFRAPTELGWVTVRVRRDGGLHSQKVSHEYQPNHELHELGALVQLVNRI